MAEGNVRYKLDLIVNLLDTTTGIPISQKEVMFRSDGQIVSMLNREEGTYILLNHGRMDMELEISVKGYHILTVPVRYERLSELFPTIEAPMIPVIMPYGYSDMCSLEGNMPGITDLAAISLSRIDALLGAYNAKKNTLRLFESRELDENDYAVLHKEDMEFEEFRIVKKTEKGMLLQLKEPLLKECKPEEGIARIVRGKTEANGRYLLRVRMDGKGTKYLVRYTVNGVTKFKKFAFGEQTEGRLE